MRRSRYEPDGQPLEPPAALAPLRVATYNMRVDHTEDVDTVHEWSQRRPAVAATILALGADLVALQEPSSIQAAHLDADLGIDWGVAISPCDPAAWEAEPAPAGLLSAYQVTKRTPGPCSLSGSL